MTQIVLFHHVLGLTDGLRHVADRLRDAGHDVLTPDLFGGRTFATIAEGLAFSEDLGDDALLSRAEDAVAGLETPIVAGVSMGGIPAEHLLLTRPVAGALLLSTFVDPGFLTGSWPDEVPVHVLGMDADPFFALEGDLDAARAWAQVHDNLHVHVLPGDRHLFMDDSTDEYDAEATRLLIARIDALVKGMAD